MIWGRFVFERNSVAIWPTFDKNELNIKSNLIKIDIGSGIQHWIRIVDIANLWHSIVLCSRLASQKAFATEYMRFQVWYVPHFFLSIRNFTYIFRKYSVRKFSMLREFGTHAHIYIGRVIFIAFLFFYICVQLKWILYTFIL